MTVLQQAQYSVWRGPLLFWRPAGAGPSIGSVDNRRTTTIGVAYCSVPILAYFSALIDIDQVTVHDWLLSLT